MRFFLNTTTHARFAVLVCVLAGTGCAAVQPTTKVERRLQQLSALLVGDYRPDGVSTKSDAGPVLTIRTLAAPAGQQIALHAGMRSERGPVSGASTLYLFDEAPDRLVNRLTVVALSADETGQIINTPDALRSGALLLSGRASCTLLMRMDGPDRFAGHAENTGCAVAVPVGASIDSIMLASETSAPVRWQRLFASPASPSDRTSQWRPKF